MVTPRIPASSSTITEVTRRAIADWFTVSKIGWWGRLDEASFVGRIFDVSALPSNDHRYSDMGADISVHRDHWTDWDNDWVFYDSRLNLLHGPDGKYAEFLCTIVHPAVRPDAGETAVIVDAINGFLGKDGWQLVASDELSGRPVYTPQPGTRPVLVPDLGFTCSTVERALKDADNLIRNSGATSGLDRVHTALHGYLKKLCTEAGIHFDSTSEAPALLATLRKQHPAFANVGPRPDDMMAVLNGCAIALGKLSPIRNMHSLAHPNKGLLDEPEAMFFINISRSILRYVDEKVRGVGSTSPNPIETAPADPLFDDTPF